MDVKRYRIDQVPRELIARWDDLLVSATPFRSPFLSYAFCRAVGKVRGGAYVLHLRAEDGAEGFLPFQYRRGRSFLGHAEKIGGHMSDHFGIVGNVGNIPDTARLLEQAGISALRLDHGVPSICPFEYRDVEWTVGCRVRTGSFAEFSDRMMRDNRDFIKGVLRGERRIIADCGVCVFDWQTGDADMVLAHLIDEKRSQYSRTRVSDSFSEPWTRKLLGELIRNGDLVTCRPVLSTLYSGGKWVASNLGLVCDKTLHIWYPAYDLQYRRYSPGHILFFKIFERASQDGIEVFDFGEGVSSYKAEYKGENYELFKGWAGRPTLAAQMERALQSLQWRVDGLMNGRNKQ